MREWWAVYGPTYGNGGRGLRVVALRRGDRLVGLLPLYVSRSGLGVNRLRFLSTGEAEFEETCPDYLNLLDAPGEAPSCTDAVASLLADPRTIRWDAVELPDLPAASPLLSLPNSLGGAVSHSITDRGTCPVADLAGGWDAYLGRLSANQRQQCRRMLREAHRAGARLELASSADDAAEYFEQLVSLHQERWRAAGKPGCFAAPRFTAFHRALATRWVPDGRAVLARLSLGGNPLALLYGFVLGGKFDFYQSGVRLAEGGGVQRPGIVAHLLLMNQLLERGVTRYDFLRGASEYKARLATDAGTLVALRLTRPTLANRADRVIGLARKSLAALSRLPRRLASRPALSGVSTTI